MTTWVRKINHHKAWQTMVWFMTGKKPRTTRTLRGLCKTEGEFQAYAMLERLNTRNKQYAPFALLEAMEDGNADAHEASQVARGERDGHAFNG